MSADSRHSETDTARFLAVLQAAEIGESRWHTAVRSLVGLGHEAIPSLIEALGHHKLSVNVGAANALKELGTVAFYDLRESLQHSSPQVRSHAAQLLYGSAIREEALVKEAVSALIGTLGDPHPDVRKWSAVALERIGDEAKQAVPHLVNALVDQDAHVREMAARALGAIGPAASEAIPKLTEILVTDDPNVRRAASDAVDQIQTVEDEP